MFCGKRKKGIIASFAMIWLMTGMVYAQPRLENLRLLESEGVLGNSYQPLWSADGRKISFEKNLADSEEKDLYIAEISQEEITVTKVNPMKTDSASFFKKTRSKRIFYDVSWSPKGSSKYAYTGSNGQENLDLFISGVGRVTDNMMADGQPAWAPNDKYIAFVSSRSGKGDIYVFDPYTLELDQLEKNKVRLTNDSVSSSLFPTWSPDGKRLAYVSHFESNDDIYVLDQLTNPQRRDHRRLTQWESSEINPSWSPDGSLLAFYSDNGHTKEFSLFVVPADGSAAPVEVANEVVKNDRHGVVWSADSKQLIYSIDNPETFNPIYLVEVAAPHKKTQVKCETQMNGDISVWHNKGQTKIAFTAQGEEGDREKRWLRVYIADLVY